MRKLLLVLFLCSLTTNALAKEFIMKCVDVNDINDIKVFTGAIDLFTRELIHIPSYDEVGDPPKVLRTCQSFKE